MMPVGVGYTSVGVVEKTFGFSREWPRLRDCVVLRWMEERGRGSGWSDSKIF